MNVTGICVRNLRSLHETPIIEIKPITILVGRNSSGKSTFARVFPLIRQSIEVRTRGPILWYGDLVDFGGFQEAITRGSDSDEITFGFDFVVNPAEVSNRLRYAPVYYSDLDYGVYSRAELLLEPLNGHVELRMRQDDRGTYASGIILNTYGTKCELEFSGEGNAATIRVNGQEYWVAKEDSSRGIVRQTGFLPKIDFVKQSRQKSGVETSRVWLRDEPLSEALYDSIKNLVHGNTSQKRILSIARQLGLGTDQMLLNHLKTRVSAPDSWKEHLRLMRVGSEAFNTLRNATFVHHLPMLVEAADSAITEFFSSVRYVEPLRATAQRYYRRQELAINEIDSKGANVAMYLDSLTATGASRFKTWMDANFGVSVSAVKEGGHIALKLKPSGNKDEFNLSDMGFGFSQLLPIAVQLWAAGGVRANQNKQAKNSTIVIEQPELHLHPQLQARLADVMVSAVKSARDNNVLLKLILETHSSHLINRLGELVATGDFPLEDANIVVFDQRSRNRTGISISQFDGDGRLVNWPFGFFDPDS